MTLIWYVCRKPTWWRCRAALLLLLTWTWSWCAEKYVVSHHLRGFNAMLKSQAVCFVSGTTPSFATYVYVCIRNVACLFLLNWIIWVTEFDWLINLRECSLICFMETWLHQDTGQRRGGRLAVLVNHRWCNPGHIISIKDWICCLDAVFQSSCKPLLPYSAQV